MLDSIKDWFVDRLHKYMDAAREIVENNEGIRSAETYYSTVKATLKKETALLTKTFCIGMGGILATQLCGWLAELLGHGILKVISAVLVLLCVCIVAFILPAVIGLLLMLRTFFFANRSMADQRLFSTSSVRRNKGQRWCWTQNPHFARTKQQLSHCLNTTEKGEQAIPPTT